MKEQVLDPVCGMMVNPETAPTKSEYQGMTYYFCSPGCKVAFERNPDKYLQNQHGHEHAHHNQD